MSGSRERRQFTRDGAYSFPCADQNFLFFHFFVCHTPTEHAGCQPSDDHSPGLTLSSPPRYTTDATTVGPDNSRDSDVRLLWCPGPLPQHSAPDQDEN
jgi:hypothetical protein